MLPSSPPSSISATTQAQPVPDVISNDPVEEAAVGSGRKWALFLFPSKKD
jgi:hypothetical protein